MDIRLYFKPGTEELAYQSNYGWPRKGEEVIWEGKHYIVTHVQHNWDSAEIHVFLIQTDK